MQKDDFIQQFSQRLKEAMLAAKFYAPRSTSGVSTHKLVEITGYSLQICRRYLRGEALPEPLKLMEIAKNLNVSAGWLLFGDEPAQTLTSKDKIFINKNLLEYILSFAAGLYQKSQRNEEVSAFLLNLINNLSKINAEEEEAKKIIDLALASVKYFNH